MDPEKFEQFGAVFSQTSFSLFMESIMENTQIQVALQRPLNLILQLDGQDFHPWDWLDYFDGSSAVAFPSLSKQTLEDLDTFSPPEWFLINRWLLDKIVREYGREGTKKGKATSYDLAGTLLHRISAYLPGEVLTELLEGYLPLLQDHKMAADFYHWLFVHAFGEDAPKMEAFLYAHQGLERAKLSGDRDRIAWGLYNLIHYHSYFDVDQAEDLLADSMEYLKDERYYDLLGHIALGHKDHDRPTKAENYLERTYEFFVQAVDNDTLLDMDTIAFSLVSFSEHLAWLYFEQNRFRECADIMQKLIRLLSDDKAEFLLLAEELDGGPDDYAYHFHGYLADAYLWTYASFERQGLTEEKLILADNFKEFLRDCPFDLKANVNDFFEEMQISFPWD